MIIQRKDSQITQFMACGSNTGGSAANLRIRYRQTLGFSAPLEEERKKALPEQFLNPTGRRVVSD